MNLLTRMATGFAAVFSLAVAAATPALAGPLDVLSQNDARLYAGAIDAAGRGDFNALDADLTLVSDPTLVGQVTLMKLMHPTAYAARYGELTDWLAAFGDQPGAERVYALSLKRRPAGAAPPSTPAYMMLAGPAEATQQAPRGAKPGLTERGLEARQAYYGGDLERALALAPGGGQRWIAGLASYRLGRFSEARGWFEAVAHDPAEDGWVRSAGAFWAARAAAQINDHDAVAPLLRLAAKWPRSFYGMIAERRLALKARALAAAPEVARFQPAAYVTSGEDEADRLVRSDARAWRAAALAQIGRPYEVALEIRAGLAAAKGEPARAAWKSLARALNAPVAAADDADATTVAPAYALGPTMTRPAGGDDFPTPDLFPTGGFTLDRALVYAIARQESRFNPYAVSRAGALGIMQVRPDAAARAAGDDQLLVNPMPLFDTATNLRIGQDHFSWLMDKLVGYDLLSAIAAYNCGPAPVMKLQKTIGAGDDLLLIESLPASETRDYVEHVAAAYWTYRQMFGGQTATLDALASGQSSIDVRLDH